MFVLKKNPINFFINFVLNFKFFMLCNVVKDTILYKKVSKVFFKTLLDLIKKSLYLFEK